MGVAKDQEFYDVLIDLEQEPIEAIVYEDYHIRPAGINKGWAHQWNRPPALLIIGALELRARQTDTKLVSQPASILPVGCGYTGYNYRKGVHVPNNVSAIAHGAYYLVKNKLATPRQFSTATLKQSYPQ